MVHLKLIRGLLSGGDIGGWTMLLHVALVGPSSNPNPAHTVTDSQFEKILIELNLHSPAHASVGDSDSEAMDTPPAPNGDQEALSEVTRRGHLPRIYSLAKILIF